MQKLSGLWKATAPDEVNISEDFFLQENSLLHLKPGKAPDPDSICPELVIHAGPSLKFWLCGFLYSWLSQLKIPKVWRRAQVIAILKPSKLVEDPQSYRPISLCPQQNPRTTDLQLSQTNSRPLTSKEKGSQRC